MGQKFLFLRTKTKANLKPKLKMKVICERELDIIRYSKKQYKY